MLLDYSGILMLVLIVVLMIGATLLASIGLSTSSMLVYDGGSYDAGIVSVVHSIAWHDMEGYMVLMSVLVHEMLLL